MNKPKNKQTSNQLIAKEGIKSVLFCIVAILVFLLLDLVFFALVVFAILVFVLVAFRNTERIPESRKEEFVLSPCDGVIKEVIVNENGTMIIIKVDFFDCGIFRVPMCVDRVESKFKFGLFIQEDGLLKEMLNTRHIIKGAKNNEIIFTMTLLPELWNKVSVYEVDSAFIGDRLGFMKYGYLLLQVHNPIKMKARIGDNVFAGQTLLGRML